ncbi:MAG: type II/IV secretion system protein, partial [bacterium]|nr:type II/IV secretion system protein [bacterium]
MISTSTKTRKLQLGQLLIKRGVLTDEQVAGALEYQRGSEGNLLLGEVMIQLNLCTEEQIMEALAEGCEVPFAHISPKITDAKVVDLLPRE